jgi:hypothetical protein
MLEAIDRHRIPLLGAKRVLVRASYRVDRCRLSM